MREFKDKENTRWQIDLTIGAAMRVKSESNGAFNLFEPQVNEQFQQLSSNVPLFWELLWHLVRPQAEARNVSADQFGELLAADCIIEARAQFMAEWHDFFQKLQQPDKAILLEKMERYNAKALELVKAQLNDPLLTTLDPRVEAKMKSQLSKSFGSMRESLDSILDPTPSGNSA